MILHITCFFSVNYTTLCSNLHTFAMSWNMILNNFHLQFLCQHYPHHIWSLSDANIVISVTKQTCFWMDGQTWDVLSHYYLCHCPGWTEIVMAAVFKSGWFPVTSCLHSLTDMSLPVNVISSPIIFSYLRNVDRFYKRAVLEINSESIERSSIAQVITHEYDFFSKYEKWVLLQLRPPPIV